MADEADHLIVVTDANGVLLSVEGSARLRLRAADHMNFAEGTLWSEPGAGTNAIGTAIAADHAVQVFGPEHFNEPVQRWTCSAAPIHDPDTGELLGVIDLTGDFSTVHPHSLAVATATAQAVEALAAARAAGARRAPARALRRPRRRRARLARAGHAATAAPITDVPASWGDARAGCAIPPGGGALMLPSGAHGDRRAGRPGATRLFVVHAAERRRAPRPAAAASSCSLLGRDRALLEVDGRSTELRPRLAEILALLCAHPEGLQRRRAVRRPARRRRQRRRACASRSRGCASCSARGSTPSATG